MEEVEAAAKAANATDFLNTMPQATLQELHVAVCCSERPSAATSDSSTCQGFSTQAGHRGAQLSGGQCLVRNFLDPVDAINSWRQFAVCSCTHPVRLVR